MAPSTMKIFWIVFSATAISLLSSVNADPSLNLKFSPTVGVIYTIGYTPKGGSTGFHWGQNSPFYSFYSWASNRAGDAVGDAEAYTLDIIEGSGKIILRTKGLCIFKKTTYLAFWTCNKGDKDMTWDIECLSTNKQGLASGCAIKSSDNKYVYPENDSNGAYLTLSSNPWNEWVFKPIIPWANQLYSIKQDTCDSKYSWKYEPAGFIFGPTTYSVRNTNGNPDTFYVDMDSTGAFVIHPKSAPDYPQSCATNKNGEIIPDKCKPDKWGLWWIKCSVTDGKGIYDKCVIQYYDPAQSDPDANLIAYVPWYQWILDRRSIYISTDVTQDWCLLPVK